MSEPGQYVCLAPGCTREPRTGRLCAGHTEKLGQWLADIEDLYATLDAGLSQATDYASTGHAGLASQRSPARLDVLVLRDKRSLEYDPTDGDPDGNRGRGVLEVLGSWARLVREQRSIPVPTTELWYERKARPAGPICERTTISCGHDTCEGWTYRMTVQLPATVTSERRVLVAQFDWITAQDWVDELYADIRAVWALLKAAHGDRSPRPQARHDWGALPDGTVCDGPIWADPGAAWCGTCRTSWSGVELLQLAGLRSAA